MQVFRDGHAGENAPAFRHHGQAVLDEVPGTLALDAFTQVLDIALHHGQSARDGFHGGGFAGTIGANQRDQLALVDMQVNALDRLDTAVSDFKARNFEKCGCHCFLSASQSFCGTDL